MLTKSSKPEGEKKNVKRRSRREKKNEHPSEEIFEFIESSNERNSNHRAQRSREEQLDENLLGLSAFIVNQCTM